jgi:hypothetical protein
VPKIGEVNVEKLVIVTTDYEIEIRIKEVKAKAEKADINQDKKDIKVVEVALPQTAAQGSKKENVAAATPTPALPVKGSKKEILPGGVMLKIPEGAMFKSDYLKR